MSASMPALFSPEGVRFSGLLNLMDGQVRAWFSARSVNRRRQQGEVGKGREKDRESQTERRN